MWDKGYLFRNIIHNKLILLLFLFLFPFLFFPICQTISICLFSQMEAKVKGTLSYHGNLSDFPAIKRGIIWLADGTYLMGKSYVVTGLLFLSMFTFLSQALWWGGKGKKMLLEQSQVQEEEMLLCKVSDLWSLKVPIVTYFKETQLSNPQKYQFDFFFYPEGRKKEVERIWINGHPSWGLDLNTLHISA